MENKTYNISFFKLFHNNSYIFRFVFLAICSEAEARCAENKINLILFSVGKTK